MTVILTFMAAFTTCQVRITKEYEKSYKSGTGDRLHLTNKYGKVIIQTREEDSVVIKVSVRTQGKNEYVVNKALGRVDIELRKVGDLVIAETKIATKGGRLNQFIGEVRDISSSIVSNQKFTIDYEVWLPSRMPIYIANRYGNVYLASLRGPVELNVAHGNIRGNRIEKNIKLKHSFGKIVFDFIKEGDLYLRGSSLKLDETEDLFFESSSSEISIAKVNTLRFDSRNDKLDVKELNNIRGNGSFTDLNLSNLTSIAQLDFSYGEIYLDGIANHFNEISIYGNSTDINLILNQTSYIQVNITGPEKSMHLPNSMLTLHREELNNDEVFVHGTTGNTNTEISSLNIKANLGKITLAIEEVPVFSSRE